MLPLIKSAEIREFSRYDVFKDFFKMFQKSQLTKFTNFEIPNSVVGGGGGGQSALRVANLSSQ